MVNSWRFLRPGDIVDVIAPGYPVKDEEIQGAIQFLRSWGLTPRIPKNLQGRHFLFSNKEEVRAQHLHDALMSKDSKIIWCLRGGYGSNHLLPHLKKMKKPKQCKLLVGISDITSLHVFLNQSWGWPTLHASLLDRLGKGLVPEKIQKELQRILFGETLEKVFTRLKPLNKAAQAVQNSKNGISAKVVGGNLIVLQSSLGTPFQFKTDKRFLFLEDIGERGYRIDRGLEQFQQAGLFKNCNGLLLGQFIGDKEPNSQSSKTKKVFKSWAEELKIPVFSGLQAGHDTWQWPLPLNTESEIFFSPKDEFQMRIKCGGKPE